MIECCYSWEKKKLKIKQKPLIKLNEPFPNITPGSFQSIFCKFFTSTAQDSLRKKVYSPSLYVSGDHDRISESRNQANHWQPNGALERPKIHSADSQRASTAEPATPPRRPPRPPRPNPPLCQKQRLCVVGRISTPRRCSERSG